MKRITIFLLIVSLLSACDTSSNKGGEKTIFVTITPLKRIVEEITCGDFHVEVLVPEGASPETFEPTARQLTALNEASKVYAIGLIDFEQNLISNLDKGLVVDLSEGIETMQGSCSHGHKHHSHGIATSPYDDGTHHIWLFNGRLSRFYKVSRGCRTSH